MSGVKINKQGGKPGLKFITFDEWKDIKDEGEWTKPGFKEIIKAYDEYMTRIVEREVQDELNCGRMSLNSKRKLLFGNFQFVESKTVALDMFNIKTPLD